MGPVAPGDRTEDLFRRYARQIYGFCLHRLGDRQDAEDAVQATFLNAFRALDHGVVPYAEAAWLFRIARNVCVSRQRAAVRRRRLESATPLDEAVASPSPVPDRERVVDLVGAVGRLPKRQRHALVLRAWWGLEYAEIAHALGLTQGAVETLLYRARRAVRTAA